MFTLKPNQKRTENELSAKLESMQFESNRRDNELRDNFLGVAGENSKENSKENSEVNRLEKENKILRNENEILQNENNKLFDENVELGKANERLKSVMSNYSNSGRKIEELEHKIEQLQQAGNLAVKYYRAAEEKLKESEAENYKLKRELTEKRNFGGVVKDKAVIASLQSKVKELEKRLLTFGRLPISETQRELIVNLYEQGCGYSKISDKVGVSRSTVSKYVVKHLSNRKAT